MDIKKVLVPVDFSENSQKILEAAGYFSGKCQAKLHAVFVVQSFDDYSGFFVPHMPVAKFEEEMVQAAEEKMRIFLVGHENIEAKVLVGDVRHQIMCQLEPSQSSLIASYWLSMVRVSAPSMVSAELASTVTVLAVLSVRLRTSCRPELPEAA